MNMTLLFSTPERERILRYLLYNPEKKATMRQIAKELSVSPSQVHKYVSMLRETGILKGMELQDMPLVRSLRLTQNLLRLRDTKTVGLLKRKIPGLKGVGMFGSWAEGSNSESSDLDLWIKVEKEPELLLLAETRRELEKRIGVSVDLVVLDEKRIKAHMEKNPPFYFSLFYSIRLWGEVV